MDLVTSEDGSSNTLDTQMRLSPDSVEVHISKSSLESIRTTSENILDKKLPLTVPESLVPACTGFVTNIARSSKINCSNVDSRTITRPKRPQEAVDLEYKQAVSGSASADNSIEMQPVAVIPPVISTPVQKLESTPVRKVESKNPSELNARGASRRNETKQPHRSRQKTVIVHNQLSLEIANTFKEVKDVKLGEDLFVEIQHHVQAFVAAKEKEWAAKHEKLVEEMDFWEHKAVERNVLIYEYDKIVRQLVEALKMMSRKNASSQTRSSKALLGGPGPERTVSPDEVALLRKDRDQLAEDLLSWETSYDELYKRYEKLRQASLEFKKNADDTNRAYEKLQEQYDEGKRKFEILKTEAENEINRANLEMERQEKLRETDTLGLRLKVKHLEAKNNALSTSLEAKMKELADMETIFEDIVHKADSNAGQSFD